MCLLPSTTSAKIHQLGWHHVLNNELRIFQAVLIWRSQTPPIMLATAELPPNPFTTILLQKFFNFYMIHLLKWLYQFGRCTNKVGPIICSDRPYIFPTSNDLLNNMIKESVVLLRVTSICTALDERQVNNAPYRFFSLRPSLTVKGPNISIPQYLTGGSSLILSLGKSAICCCWNIPLKILHLTAALQLITQYLEVLTALIVIPLPAWAT